MQRAFELKANSDGYKLVAGCDEVGRGSLAGPVVAAAVILPVDFDLGPAMKWVRDSKTLSKKKRDEMYELLTASHSRIKFGIGIVDAQVIDRINIFNATMKAMREAILNLPIHPDYLLIDGNSLPMHTIPGEAIPQGDAKEMCISAASIIAKVTRDRMMIAYSVIYPNWSFDTHVGYGAKTHCDRIHEALSTPIHRKSFNPLRSILQAQNANPLKALV
jgi:ribonuclease HII